MDSATSGHYPNIGTISRLTTYFGINIGDGNKLKLIIGLNSHGNKDVTKSLIRIDLSTVDYCAIIEKSFNFCNISVLLVGYS